MQASTRKAFSWSHALEGLVNNYFLFGPDLGDGRPVRLPADPRGGDHHGPEGGGEL